LPAPPKLAPVSDAVLAGLQSEVQAYPTAAGWRKVAERAVLVKDFPLASEAFSKESAIYRDKGSVQAALAEESKARQYGTESQLFQTKPAVVPSSLERLEPSSGCYVGAFIDRDDTLKKHQFASQIHGDIEQFNDLVGKPHASFFMYRAYGKPFPRKWAEFVKSHGAVPHIAWEPKDLKQVRDDDYLNHFLAEAKAFDHPLMLRFASEMNGAWTPYNGDPEAYKEAFRLVYEKSRSAPKVALMWCPNSVPRSTIEDYYPGDDFVDWVGVNFYSVPFLDNDPNRPGDLVHPTDHLRDVYETYSTKKPIAIGEWAASRQSALTDRNLQDFGTGKMAALYADLPTRFPRVKMVNWYDCDNIEEAKDSRKLNNFQLTDSEQVLGSYQRAVSSQHFLGAGQTSSALVYEPVAGKLKLSEADKLRLALKSYDPKLRVFFEVDQKVIHASDNPLEWYVTGAQLASGGGKGRLRILVYDSSNRFVMEQTADFQVEKS
jgi:hypothetical protein